MEELFSYKEHKTLGQLNWLLVPEVPLMYFFSFSFLELGLFGPSLHCLASIVSDRPVKWRTTEKIESGEKSGAHGRIRTYNLFILRYVLYRCDTGTAALGVR